MEENESNKAQIEIRISELCAKRAQVLKNYVADLGGFDAYNGSTASVNRAGILHDLDRHITNLELELKRMEVTSHV